MKPDEVKKQKGNVTPYLFVNLIAFNFLPRKKNFHVQSEHVAASVIPSWLLFLLESDGGGGSYVKLLLYI